MLKCSNILLMIGLFLSLSGRGMGAPSLKEIQGSIYAVALSNAGVGILLGNLENGKGYGIYLNEGGDPAPFLEKSSCFDRFVMKSAAITPSGLGIIGGSKGEACYFGLIDQSGALKEGPFIGDGVIWSVSIASSRGIIGGHKNGFAYAAFVSGDGQITPIVGIPKQVGVIQSVAINSSGRSIIGGWRGGLYGALVDPSGQMLTPLTGEVPSLGELRAVALNDAGVGLIGGKGSQNEPYAAKIDSNGTATILKGGGAPEPENSGFVQAVAINGSGFGIVGGDQNGSAYAALVDPTGRATALKGNGAPNRKESGLIEGVAINASGFGILGGEQNEAPYAALVDPDGNTTALIGNGAPEGKGKIWSVAINDAGVGLFGGVHEMDQLYAALVAPNGAITPLSNLIFQKIEETQEKNFSNFREVFRQIDPKSFGVGGAFADALFTLSKGILGTHLSALSQKSPAFALVASAHPFEATEQKKSRKVFLWASPLALYAHHKGDKEEFSLKNRGIGKLLGLDYSGENGQIFGAALTYVCQNAHGKRDGRRAQMHQELMTLYTSFCWKRCIFEGAVWGGLLQMKTNRFTLETLSSKSQVKGALVSPHFKIGALLETKKGAVLPFAQFDWAHSWQGSVKERGQSGLNLQIDSHHLSILRSEIGVEYEQRRQIKGRVLTFREGISYVNTAPFHTQKVDARYVQSGSTFSLALSSPGAQHFGALFLLGTFRLKREAVPTVSLCYQGEFGSQRKVHALGLEIRQRF